MTVRLGVIADDFTGATDIAGFLVAAGLRTLQLNEPATAQGIPDELAPEAVVISLKTRSIPARDAVAQSLEALRILDELGAERIVFKYCSTFDSTPRGNIGPVTDALLEALGEDLTVVVPALPVNGRTVYRGTLFVHHQLLAESGMRDHPVTPMTDSNLLRLMDAQSQGRSISIPFETVDAGPEAVRAALAEARAEGARYAVLDTLTHEHLDTIGEAVRDLRLVTGGSGLGSGLARALTGASEGGTTAGATEDWRFSAGPGVVISGSSSQMTNRQVSAYRRHAPSTRLDVVRVIDEAPAYLEELTEWVLAQAPDDLAPMVYATAEPAVVKDLQTRFGAERVSGSIELFFGRLAAALRERGITRFVSAGGETSGSVTKALGISGFEVGPQIAPGVPWTRALGQELDLALKSGNFGDEEFFLTAQKMAAGGATVPARS